MKPLTLVFIVLLAIFGLGLITLMLIGDDTTNASSSEKEELTKVTFRMHWTPTTSWVPYMLALDKGFYAEEGLDVEFLAVKGSPLAVKIIASKGNDFGMASANTVLTGKTKGMPLKVVAVIWQRSLGSVIYNLESGIESPGDLEGKKIGSDLEGNLHQEFLGFAKKNNIDLEKVEIVPLSGTPQRVQALIRGDVDGIIMNYHKTETILDNAGFTQHGRLAFDDYGINIYGQTLIAHEDTIKEKPEIVRKLVRATLKALEYSIANPEEAAQSLVNHFPEMNAADEIAKFNKMKRVLKTDETIRYGFGYQTQESWENLQDLWFDLGLIDKKIDVNTLFTNEFLK